MINSQIKEIINFSLNFPQILKSKKSKSTIHIEGLRSWLKKTVNVQYY